MAAPEGFPSGVDVTCVLLFPAEESMAESRLQDVDLAPIVRIGREGIDLDYKGPGNWDEWSTLEKAELLRDMIGMANGDGPGYIVLGASDDGGVVGRYDGLTEAQASSFDPSKVADMMKRYADPEIGFDLYKPAVDGKNYVVIRVHPFSSVPHICRRSCGDILQEAAVYVRGEGARTVKVPSAEHMRRMVDRAVQVSADVLVERIRRLVCGVAPVEGEAGSRFADQIARVRRELEGEDA